MKRFLGALSIAFAFVCCAGVAQAQLAADPGWVAPDSFSFDALQGGTASDPIESGEVAAQIEAMEEQHERSISTRAAKAEREDSVDAFSGLGPNAAISLIKDVFAEPLNALTTLPSDPVLASESTPKFHRGLDTSVSIDPPGPEDAALVVSNMPLRNEDGEIVSGELTSAQGGFKPEAPLANVDLPAGSGGQVELSDVGVSFGFEGTVNAAGRLIDAASGEGREMVLYPNAQTDTDTAITYTLNGIETFNYLRSADSPESLSLGYDLPQGASLRATDDGGAIVLDSEGEALVTIYPPYAVDAQGSEVPMTLSVEGDRIVLNVPHRGKDFAYPIMVDPVQHIRDWWNSGASAGYEGWGFYQTGTTNYNNSLTCPSSLATIDPCGGTGDGLYASAVPTRSYPADSKGYWRWAVPGGASSSIKSVTLDSWRYRKGSNNAGWAFYNLWDSPSGYTVTTGGGGGGVTLTGGSSGVKYFQMGLATSTANTIPTGATNWRYARLGAYTAVLTDGEAPTVTLTDFPTTWLGPNTNFNVDATVQDAGLGIGAIDTSVGAGVWQNKWFAWCSGTYPYPCLNTPVSKSLTFNSNDLQNGMNALQVKAKDIVATSDQTPNKTESVGHETSQGLWTRVDKTGPTIVKTGPLTSGAAGTEITVRIDDNALNNPTFDSAGDLTSSLTPSEYIGVRSGAKDFKLYVDNQQVDSRSRTCTAIFGSCRLAVTFKPNLSSVADGVHDLKIVATDQVGNSTQTAVWQDTIDKTPPTMVSASAESEWNSGAKVPVSVAGGDDLEGISRIIVRRGATVVHSHALDCSSGCPNVFRDKVEVPVSGLVNGENTLAVSLEGPAGDEGNAISLTTNVEKADPVISNVDSRAWYSDQGSITVEAGEHLSGLAGVKVLDASNQVVGQAPFDCDEPCTGVEEIEVPLDLSGLAQGPQQLSVVVTSNAESESTETLQIGVDRTPPTLDPLGGSLAALADQYLDTSSSYNLTTGAGDGSGPTSSGLTTVTATWDGEDNPLQDQRDCTSVSCANITFGFDLSQVLDGYRTVTVNATDRAGNVTTDEVSFDLDRSGPAIEIRAENAASQTWGNGADLEVAVDVTDGPVDDQRIGTIEVEIDGNQVQPLNEPSECEDLCTLLHFKVSNAAAGPHTVDVEATDTLGHTSQAQQVITLDRDAPTIEVDGDLEDGATVGGGDQGITVNAEETGTSPSGVAGIRLFVDGTMFEGGEETCDSGECAYEVELDENVLPVGQHRIEIKAPDQAGNIATESLLVERECSAGTSTVTTVANPVTAQDAVDAIETDHADVVAPSQTEVIEGNELSPTLVERDTALDADSTAQPSQLAAGDTPEMVVGVGDQSVCLRPSEIGDSATEPAIVNEDTAVYANTSEATDTAVRPTVDGVESYSILRSGDAPESFSLEVGTPGDTNLVENQDGTVSVTLDPADLDVPERPEDIPPLDGQAAELIADGQLPPDTVDAGIDIVENATADIAEKVGERPEQSEAELGLGSVVPSETGSSVSDPAPTAAETIGALETLDESAVETGQDLIETESQAFEDAEQTAIDASQTAEAATESDALDDVQAEDVEIAKISAPEAKDAEGDPVPVSLTADGSSVEVAVQHEGEGYEYPIAVDPVVETKKMVIVYEPYPVYRNERYISGYENVRKKIGMWDARSCKWTSCVLLNTSWYRVSGKYLAWLPNGKNVAYKTPLYETYKKPIFGTRKVFDHWGQKPVLREQRTLDAQTSGGGNSRKVGDMQTGMNLSGFQVDAYEHATDPGVKTVPSMKEQQGINTAVLNPHWYVNSLNGWRLKPWYGKDGKSPSRAGIASLLQASANQMSRVVMKPHLEVDGKSRTEFLPAKRNRNAFWKRYEKFIRFHATLMANNTNGNPNRAFVIGTELSQLQGEAYTGRWSRLVNVAKNILPHGTKIYYAANWDTIDSPPQWWRMMDGIGVDAYPGWYGTPWNADDLTAKLSRLHEKVDVPVFFSETGAYTEERYKKRDDYTPILPARTPAQQASVYRDILNAVTGLERRLEKQNKNWFLGVWWYDRYTRATPNTEGNTYDMWTPRPGAVKALCTYQTTRPGKC